MRITNKIREDIITGLLKLKFKSTFDRITEWRTELADALYDEHIKPPCTDPEWIHHGQHITVDHVDFDYHYRRQLDGVSGFVKEALHKNLKLSVSKPLPIRSRYDEKYVPSANLAKRFTRLAERVKKTEKEYTAMETDLRKILYSVNTLKQLRAAWPEGEDLYKDYLPSRSVSTALVDPSVALRVTAAFTPPLVVQP